MDITLQAIYIIFTIFGVISYNLTGYYTNLRKKQIAIEKGEIAASVSRTEDRYSFTKLARTFMTGGFASLIATVVAYSAQVFEPQYVLLSFVNGAIFCAGIDKLEDLGKKKGTAKDPEASC